MLLGGWPQRIRIVDMPSLFAGYSTTLSVKVICITLCKSLLIMNRRDNFLLKMAVT